MLFECRMNDIEVFRCISFDFPYHLHNHVEILVCTDGALDVTCNDQNRTLYRGDLMIAFPGDVHSYHKTEHGKGIIIIFKPDISGLISDSIMHCVYENFVTRREAIALAEDLLKNSAGNFMVLYGYLHAIIGMILKKTEETVNNPHRGTFHAVVEYVAFHYTEPISLKSIARHLGISQSYVSRLFSEKIEGGFKQYLNLLRVEKEKTLLNTTDLSICEIMYASGFSDQCTFNRVFLQRENCSPRAYRKQRKNGYRANMHTEI